MIRDSSNDKTKQYMGTLVWLIVILLTSTLVLAGCSEKKSDQGTAANIEKVAARKPGIFEQSPYPYVGFVTQTWTSLTKGEREALEALGFNEKSWTDKDLPEATLKPSTQLTPEQRDLLKHLPIGPDDKTDGWIAFWQDARAKTLNNKRLGAGIVKYSVKTTEKNLTKEQAIQAYHNFAEACTKKDVDKVWQMLSDEERRKLENVAKEMRTGEKDNKDFWEYLKYKGAVEDYDGKERLREYMTHAQHKWNLCSKSEGWTMLDPFFSKFQGQYIIPIKHPLKDPEYYNEIGGKLKLFRRPDGTIAIDPPKWRKDGYK